VVAYLVVAANVDQEGSGILGGECLLRRYADESTACRVQEVIGAAHRSP
jgi:hypothetical protein